MLLSGAALFEGMGTLCRTQLLFRGHVGNGMERKNVSKKARGIKPNDRQGGVWRLSPAVEGSVIRFSARMRQ